MKIKTEFEQHKSVCAHARVLDGNDVTVVYDDGDPQNTVSAACYAFSGSVCAL